jgi:hypothetical protein
MKHYRLSEEDIAMIINNTRESLANEMDLSDEDKRKIGIELLFDGNYSLSIEDILDDMGLSDREIK